MQKRRAAREVSIVYISKATLTRSQTRKEPSMRTLEYHIPVSTPEAVKKDFGWLRSVC